MATATIRATQASPPGRKSAGALADGRHGVGPEAGPLAFDGSCRGRPSPCRRSPPRALRPRSWKCRPWPDQVIDRRRRNALDLGFLDHRRRDLLRHAPRFKGAWEVAAGAKLWNRQPASPCPAANRHRRRNPPHGLIAPIIRPKRKATPGRYGPPGRSWNPSVLLHLDPSLRARHRRVIRLGYVRIHPDE